MSKTYTLDPFWKEVIEVTKIWEKIKRQATNERYKRYKTNTELPEEKAERCINTFLLTEVARLLK